VRFIDLTTTTMHDRQGALCSSASHTYICRGRGGWDIEQAID